MRIGPVAVLAAVLCPSVAPAQALDDRPGQLPPLLPIPPANTPVPQLPPGPSGPGTEYDPGYLYIPEQAPETVRTVIRSAERWRFAVSAELAWLATRPTPEVVKLRPPDAFGTRVPGITLPLGGRVVSASQAGLGLTVVRWLGDARDHAIETNLFLLPDSSHTVTAFAPGTLVYFPDPAQSAPLLVRYPDSLRGVGTAFPATAATSFVGLDVNYRRSLIATAGARLDAVVGYRFAYLADEVYLGDEPVEGNTEYKRNRLLVENTFHGGQIGLAGEIRTETWYTEGVVKLAYGAVHTNQSATGAFQFARPAAVVACETRGAFLPTVGVRLGYQLSNHGRLFAGYSFQYLDRVARLGDAFAGGPETTRDFWVQSIGLGFECRY